MTGNEFAACTFSRLGDSQSFAYDANGNRTASQGTRQYDTDLDGNLSTDGLRKFEYPVEIRVNPIFP